MDLQLLSFPISISLFVFVFTVLITLKISLTNKSISKLPPGPWQLPIIGNLHQIIGAVPHRRLRELARKYGPLMHIKIGEVPTLVVSSPEWAREVMRTQDAVFASRPPVLFAEIVLYSSGILFCPYSDYWRKAKKVCVQELLTPARVQSFSGIRREEMSNLVEWISSNAGSVINLTKRINEATCTITARAAFGKKIKDEEEFISVVDEASRIASGFDLADVFPSFSFLDPLIFGTRAKLEKLRQRNDKIFDDIIKEYKLKKQETRTGESETVTEDLVDILLKFQDSGHPEFSLTTQSITAILFDIFTGGTETSSTVLDWAMAELMKHPKVMKKAQNDVREVFLRDGSINETNISEMKYMKSVVKEAMRLHPSASLLVPRETRAKCELNGYEIPLKTRVIINAWAIGRDPAHWTDPESFIPDRFLDSPIDYKGSHFEFIPFGAGRRICPGMSFGVINVELPLATLLCHFDWKLPSGVKPEDLDMTDLAGISTRRKDELHLIPTPYDQSPIDKSGWK